MDFSTSYLCVKFGYNSIVNICQKMYIENCTIMLQLNVQLIYTSLQYVIVYLQTHMHFDT